MASSPSNSRKVRFSLPGSESFPPVQPSTIRHQINRSPTFEHSIQSADDRYKVHGTTTYVNGTLVKIPYNDPLEVEAIQLKHLPRSIPTAKLCLKSCIKEIPKVFDDDQNWDHLRSDIRSRENTSNEIKIAERIQLKERPRNFETTFYKRIPLSQSSCIIFSPSKCVKTIKTSKSTPKFNQRKKLIPDLLKLPDLLKVHNQRHFADTEKMIHFDDDIYNEVPSDFQEFDLYDDDTCRFDRAECERLTSDLKSMPHMNKLLIDPEENLTDLLSASERYRSNCSDSTKNCHFQLSKLLRISSKKDAAPVKSHMRFMKSQNSTATKYKTKIMSFRKAPMVTSLLRASRDADEEQLTDLLTDIVASGITSEHLNAADSSGRTALSYICSTNLTNILEICLQLPRIDVNKADNEGNTPLHFAAQAGQSDIINMLITKSRSLQIDAKNNMGLTPLMKAALQGRIRCAKLLLFAGASPVEVDSTRRMRADEWSRLCGRYSCAEMIEQCSRARLLETNTSSRWARDVLTNEKNKNGKAKQQLSNGGGIRSRFGWGFPFKLSFKQSKNRLIAKDGSESSKHVVTNQIDGISFLPKIKDTKKPPNSYSGALVKVPKLEVTLACSKSLVKRYEEISINDDNNFSCGDLSFKTPSNRKIY